MKLCKTKNITELQNKMQSENAFLLAELDKIALYYQLKHTIRWGHTRDQDETESVAEHIYGMHILIDYFLPIIDQEDKLDHTLVRQLATWHDMAEAVVSDMTTNTKTEAHKEAEKLAELEITNEATLHIRDKVREIFQVYNDQVKAEAKFVKAIDKIEPMFHLYFLSKNESDLRPKFDLGWSAEEYQEHRNSYIVKFPILKQFDNILYNVTKDFHPTA